MAALPQFTNVLSLPFLTCLISSSSVNLVSDTTEDFASSDLIAVLSSLLLVIAEYDIVTSIAS